LKALKSQESQTFIFESWKNSGKAGIAIKYPGKARVVYLRAGKIVES